MLSAKPDELAAKHFFRRVIQSNHAAPPYAMTQVRAYPKVASLVRHGLSPLSSNWPDNRL